MKRLASRSVGSVASAIAVGVVALLPLAPPRSVASLPIIFEGMGGNLQARATFEQFDAKLVITLSNISPADVMVPADILTAVFFTLAGDPSLMPVSAIVPAGSMVLFGTTDPGNNVGGEWAYKNHLKNAPYAADEGISTAGFGLFGPKDRFPGSNLQGPDNIAGMNYGIVSAGDNPAMGNQPVTGKNALIKNAVVFTLTGLPLGYRLTPASISAVSFQYGTSLPPEEPNLRGTFIPEPSTGVLVAAGLLLARMLYRRRRDD